MNPVRDAWAQALVSALEEHAVAVAQMAPGHWSFAPAGAPGLHATASMTDDWILFDAPLPKSAAGVSAWEVFAANAMLPGGLKVCIGESDPALRIRAEQPLLEQLPLGRIVQEVCAGLAAAAAGLQPDALGPRLAPNAATSGEGDAAAGMDLQQLCAQTAWPFTVRGSDTVTVELDVPGAFQQAAVELQPNRGVSVSVPALSGLPCAPVCETAVAIFLLRLTGAVRMVRAAARSSRLPVIFEVVRTAPAPEELANAFAALSIAWRWAGREAAVLAADERVAELYLHRAAADIGASTLDFSTATCGQCPHLENGRTD